MDQRPSQQGVAANGGDEPDYAYKPSLLGAPWEFRLGSDRLVWAAGPRTGSIPYGSIRRVRLSFRPATMQSYRFLAEIWSDAAPKLTIYSTSWRGMTEQERLDQSYRDFVLGLHRHIAAAGGKPVLEAGSSPFLYWPGVGIVAVLGLCIIALLLRALSQESWPAVLFLSGFFAVLLWQMGGFFMRNRPQAYEAGAIPERVLPKPKS